MKILVVDDQPDVVAGILDGVNWRALHVEKAYSALSAAEAKDLLLREKIDILLCDIEMPGESGLSLVSWLQKQGRETKCIFLTAHADFPYAQKHCNWERWTISYSLQAMRILKRLFGERQSNCRRRGFLRYMKPWGKV